MNRKEITSFRKSIPAESGVLQFKERIKAEGTIEKVSVRFYQGQQLKLKVQPFLLKHGGQPVKLIDYADGTDAFLSGDDDYFQYPVGIQTEYDDYILIIAENTALFECNMVVDVVVDYVGGKRRVV